MLSTLHDSELRKVGSRGLVYEFQAPEFEQTPLISWREGADRDGGGGRCNNGVAALAGRGAGLFGGGGRPCHGHEQHMYLLLRPAMHWLSREQKANESAPALLKKEGCRRCWPLLRLVLLDVGVCKLRNTIVAAGVTCPLARSNARASLVEMLEGMLLPSP